jgi:hypothetical protein
VKAGAAGDKAWPLESPFRRHLAFWTEPFGWSASEISSTQAIPNEAHALLIQTKVPATDVHLDQSSRLMNMVDHQEISRYRGQLTSVYEQHSSENSSLASGYRIYIGRKALG